MEDGDVTKADLRDLESRLKVDMHDLESRLKSHLEGRMDALEQRINERMASLIHETETKLLQAFYGFAEATNKRFNQIDGNMGIFFNRLGTVENRLLEVEKRLNIPPTTQ